MKHSTKTPNGVFDLMKFILSIMVVAIHSGLFPNILYPWLRLAVPLFFILSSYFFFKKIKNETDVKKQKIILTNFIKRNLQLYLFWFILLLPVTLIVRNFLDFKSPLVILFIIRDFIFSSTFKASWFIMATVIGTTIIYYLSKKLSNSTIFIICFFIYVLICLSSTYFYLFEKNIIILKIKNYYELIFCHPYNSYPISLIWIICGKIFADGDTYYFKNKSTAWITFIISALFLYIEWTFVKKQTNIINNDCYIMLLPMSISIFSLICTVKLNLKHSITLRNLSTFTYALHASLTSCLPSVLRLIKMDSPSILFIITLIICWSCGLLVISLKKIKHFSWLKYSM